MVRACSLHIPCEFCSSPGSCEHARVSRLLWVTVMREVHVEKIPGPRTRHCAHDTLTHAGCPAPVWRLEDHLCLSPPAPSQS